MATAENVMRKVGNGVAPEKMLQAYSVPFLLAELYLTGNANGDAKEVLKEGIKRSINHVNSVAKASDANVPAISNESIEAFIEKSISKV